MHPLYYQARGMVGQPVYVHHRNGRTYHGTLQSVTEHGIYLMPHAPGARLASHEEAAKTSCDLNAVLVYYPGAYFGFGALAGLTLGALLW